MLATSGGRTCNTCRVFPDPAVQLRMAMASVRVRPMTTDDAMHISSWRYPDRWSVYDLTSSTNILDELDLYWAVTDGDGTLIGFFCQESAARVRGLNQDPEILDVGVGMDPCLVGQGSGRALGEVMLDHLGRRYPGRPLRAVIQSWNVRSRRFAATLGFVDVGELASSPCSQQDSYRILLKPEAGSSRGSMVTQSGVWLFGDRLMLREVVAEDHQAVHAYASDPAVTKFTDWGPNRIGETQAFRASAAAQRRRKGRAEFTLAMVQIASGTLVGSGAISVTSAHHRRGELGYVVNRDYWSQGYATEAAGLLVQFGFQHLRLRRIEATCDPGNHASARVLQKAGLSYEGLMRSHMLVGGVGRDSLLYAVIDKNGSC